MPGDRPLSLALPVLPTAGLSPDAPGLRLPQGVIHLRALRSAKYSEFSAGAQTAFCSTPYRITPQSNGQGDRQKGAELTRTASHELRSHGIVPRIVQVPNGGQPIIQLADSAAMGGYPKIEAVIEADLWRLGQGNTGDALQFTWTDASGAAAAAQALAETMTGLAGQLAATTAQQRGWK